MTKETVELHLETIWKALHEYRDELIPEGGLVNDTDIATDNDARWDDICLSMAVIRESLGMLSEVETSELTASESDAINAAIRDIKYNKATVSIGVANHRGHHYKTLTIQTAVRP